MKYFSNKLKTITVLLIAVSTTFTGLISTSCSTKKKTTAKNLRLYLQAEPYSLDPRVGGDRRSQLLMRQLFEGLTRIDKNGKPQLAAAEKVDISKDGCTYTFTIRKSNWSNGEPVVAKDFEYAWKAALSPDFATGFQYIYTLIKGAEAAKLGHISLDDVGIHAHDDKTLVVELEHPAPYFLELTSNPLYSPLCNKVVKENPDWHKQGGPLYVTNGPFTLTSWEHHKEVVFQKNEHYREKDVVKTDRVSFSIVENPQTALGLFENKQLDWVGEPFGTLPLDAIVPLKNSGKLETHPVAAVYWYECNTTNELLKSQKIRKALASALDRKEITEQLLQGGEKPSLSILPQTLSCMKGATFTDGDTVTAKRLFKEGLDELGFTEETMPEIALTHWSDPREKALASSVQEKLANTLGVKLKLISCDWATFLKNLSTGNFDLLGVTWYSYYNDPIYILDSLKYKNGGMNGTQWEDPRFIALLDKSDKEVDSMKRTKILGEAESLALTELPLIPMYCHTYKFQKVSNLQDVLVLPVGQLELKYAYLDS